LRRIIKTSGIVVRVLPYRESSLIFRLYTPYHGLLSGMARGARRPNSSFGSALRTFVKADFIFFLSSKSEFYHLTEVELCTEPGPILTDEDRYLVASAMVGLIMKISPPGLPNPKLYERFDCYLERIKISNGWIEVFGNFVSFVINVLRIIGYLPPLDRCVICGSDQINGFSIKQGGCLCADHLSQIIESDRALIIDMRRVAGGERVDDLTILTRIFSLLAGFIRYHIGEVDSITRMAIDRKREQYIIG